MSIKSTNEIFQSSLTSIHPHSFHYRSNLKKVFMVYISIFLNIGGGERESLPPPFLDKRQHYYCYCASGTVLNMMGYSRHP